MPEEVDEMVDSILDDNPDMDDEEAWAIAYDQHEGPEEKAALAKAAPNGSISKMEFEVVTEGEVGVLFKNDDDFIIWGPASVEVVDKENDRIKAKALEDALPQLLKRQRLSYEHTDQLVGDILERYTTDEPVTVKIGDREFERSEFPTDVLKLEGIEPALYVAGNVYNDSQKAQEVRKGIDNGDINSYSISGEAVVTEMTVKNGRVVNDILKLDLSAVTLCKQGMNQKAKFGVVSAPSSETAKRRLTPQRAAAVAKRAINKRLPMEDNDNEIKKFLDAMESALDKRLPDGELATKEDVEQMVEEKIEEKAQEGSPTDGTPSRPDGRSDSPKVDDPQYDGDVDEWGSPPPEESDKVEDTNVSDDKNASASAKAGDARAPEDQRRRDPDSRERDTYAEDEKSYTTEELKSILPDDQFKTIAPLLEEKAGDEMEVVPPEEDQPPEEAMGAEEEELELAEKSIEDLDWDRLSDEQKKAVAKSGLLAKASNSASVGTPATPGHDPDDVQLTDEIAKADNDSVASDPALRNIYGEDGEVLI